MVWQALRVEAGGVRLDPPPRYAVRYGFQPAAGAGCSREEIDVSLRRIAALVLLGLVAGCGAEQSPQTQYRPVLDAKSLMNWVLDPSADVIWGSAGTIMTLEGEEDLAPTTDEGWDAVRNAAATLAEMGNVLRIPGHSRGADWDEIADGLTQTAVLLMGAAERRNDQEVFDYGGQLYNVCVACHQLYMLPESDQ
jgi:hypothetical protein